VRVSHRQLIIQTPRSQ
jgi:hypothetical protein